MSRRMVRCGFRIPADVHAEVAANAKRNSTQPENVMTAIHPVDAHVGNRVRIRRQKLGISQTALGNAARITFQQVQKYERGTNRMSASRLFQFAQALEVPVGFFFEGAPKERAPRRGRRVP